MTDQTPSALTTNGDSDGLRFTDKSLSNIHFFTTECLLQLSIAATYPVGQQDNQHLICSGC
jgi:hypothetical protein